MSLFHQKISLPAFASWNVDFEALFVSGLLQKDKTGREVNI
jgi:hypothetical protein